MRTRFLSLLTAVLLAAGIIFLTGCDNTQPENTISAEALAERFGGYTIVRPDSASDGEVSAAVYLRSAFEENGYTISITTDWVNRGEEVPADTPEILVGQTNRAETARYAADLRQGEFAVAREGNRYVLTGGSEDAVQSACAWFVQFALGWDGEGLYEGGDVFTQKKTYRVDSPTIGGNALREYSILYTDAVNNEEEAALGLQQTILEETGWLLPAKKISIAEVDKERYDRQILLQADKTMEEGYKITLQDGKMAITGSDRIQLQGAVMALRKEMEESSMTYENGTILEGKLTRQSLTLYADPGARTGGDGSASAPFATGDEVMAGILAKASEAPYDITVQMKGGDYRISRTMTLDAAGVGVLGSTVEFVCADENEARFCAWVPVTGFAETTVNGVTAWAADLPKVRGEVLYPNQCFSVSGQRLERPRYPEGEEELMAQLVDRTISSVQWNESMNMFGYRDETIETFSRPEDIQIHMFHYWNDERLEIGSIDTAGNRITTKTNSSMAFIEYTKGAPYYFDNVYEMLKKPGQFYVDKKENKLLYIPQAGEKIDECTLYASDIDVILTIDGFHGTAETPALSFRNIGFVGSDWKSTTRASSQAASDIHGAVRVNNSSHIIFDSCTFTGIGNYALEIQNGVSHLEVTHCTFRDIGAGGITIYGVNTVPVTDEVNHDLTITDNYIGSYGRVHANGIGIVLRYAYDCTLSHNEITYGYYSGISVGWSWGYNPHATGNILVEKNHIYNIGQYKLSDMGGIYTLGLQPGTVLRGNLIHNVYSRTDKAWGLYTDEGSTDILIENNISYDVKSEAFHQHYGKDNIVRNNILALGHDGIVMVSRLEDHTAIHLERNILLSDGAPIYLQHPDRMNMQDDSNLMWNLSGDIYCSGEKLTVADVQAKGLFQNAVIADPGFADPHNGDFTLPADSPAYSIGFEPIDMSDVGIRAK